MQNHEIKLFSGTANPKLTQAICDALGCKPGKAVISRFPDGETSLSLRMLPGIGYPARTRTWKIRTKI